MITNVIGSRASRFPGYIVNSTPANGDCLFEAIADQLSITGFKTVEKLTANSIRQQLVQFVKSNSSHFHSDAGLWNYIANSYTPQLIFVEPFLNCRNSKFPLKKDVQLRV